MDDWIDEVCGALAIEEDVDIDLLLDVARVVAHKVERRAAPVTTYIIGLAAARERDDPEAAASAARIVTALAERWNKPVR
jgi:Domain of unknown function (DUF6457)